MRYSLHAVLLSSASVERGREHGQISATPPWQQQEVGDSKSLNLAIKASPSHSKLAGREHHYLVRLPVTAEYRVVPKGTKPGPEDKVRLLVEVEYSGVFEIAGDSEAVTKFLGTTAATILFPYASQTINDLVAKTGCLPVFLPPLDFASLAQQVRQQAEADASATRQ